MPHNRSILTLKHILLFQGKGVGNGTVDASLGPGEKER